MSASGASFEPSKAQTISSMRGWSCLPASNPTSLGQARDYRRMDSWNTKTTAQLIDIGLTTARGRDTTHAALHTNSRPTGRNMCVNTPPVRVPHVTVTWVSGVPGFERRSMPDTTRNPRTAHARYNRPLVRTSASNMEHKSILVRSICCSTVDDECCTIVGITVLSGPCVVC